MKKMLMALAVFAFVGTSSVTYAQCSKGKTASTVSGKKSCAASCASKLAANDASIEKTVCEKSGKVSYMRKATCEKSGKTSLTPVQYDAASKKFVNVSPAADVQLVGGEKKMCAKSAAAAAKLASNDENIESKVCAKSGNVSYFSKQTCAKSGKVSMTPVKYCSDSKKFVNVAPAADDVRLVGGEKKSCSKSAAAKLASNDENIEAKVCEKSGKVAYFSKQTCAKSGKVSMTPVKYCSDSKKFVNAAPAADDVRLVSGEKKMCAKSAAAAAKLASNDKNIESKVCAKSGNVSYFSKQTCAKSGKVSMTPVKYCSDSKKFVNVAPEGEVKSTLTGNAVKSSQNNAKKACTKAEKKACSKAGKKACSGKAKSTMQGSQK